VKEVSAENSACGTTPDSTPGAAIRAELMRVIADVMAQEELADERSWDPDAKLTDLGLDSMGLIYLFTHFEREYGVRFDNDATAPEIYENMASLVRAIEVTIAARQ
jgi:acyl carrier protein